jgi:hypothetical protein
LLPPNHDNASTYLYITQKVLAKSIVDIADFEKVDKLIVAKKFYDELTRLLKCALVIKQDESICEISNDSSITIEEYLGIIEKIDTMVLEKIRNEMIDKLPKKSQNTGAYLYLIARVGVKVICATFMRVKTKQDLISYAKKIIHDINDLIKDARVVSIH